MSDHEESKERTMLGEDDMENLADQEVDLNYSAEADADTEDASPEVVDEGPRTFRAAVRSSMPRDSISTR
jgi:hypothetical protein